VKTYKKTLSGPIFEATKETQTVIATLKVVTKNLFIIFFFLFGGNAQAKKV
jgi:hypothetical protein